MRQGDTLLVTSQRERVWWRNFRGGAVVSVRLAGAEREAFAEVVEEDAGVAAGLAVYLGANPQAAKFFGVPVDEAGKLDPEGVARAATERVIVKLKLSSRQ
ncbi:MAG: hypothetical protein HPY76_05110 [Anaerolineae bacterium]|nr:hypothetical protein [Anaerolineae bacterium]